MKDILYWIEDFIEQWGILIGCLMVATPILWDILYMGFGDMSNWRVCKYGMLMQAIGAFILIPVSVHLRKKWRKNIL